MSIKTQSDWTWENYETLPEPAVSIPRVTHPAFGEARMTQRAWNCLRDWALYHVRYRPDVPEDLAVFLTMARPSDMRRIPGAGIVVWGEIARLRRHMFDAGQQKEVRRHTAPAFQTWKDLQFYARDSDGQWHCLNEAGHWTACAPPVEACVRTTEE